LIAIIFLFLGLLELSAHGFATRKLQLRYILDLAFVDFSYGIVLMVALIGDLFQKV
jgi:hypothetical protein